MWGETRYKSGNYVVCKALLRVPADAFLDLLCNHEQATQLIKQFSKLLKHPYTVGKSITLNQVLKWYIEKSGSWPYVATRAFSVYIPNEQPALDESDPYLPRWRLHIVDGRPELTILNGISVQICLYGEEREDLTAYLPNGVQILQPKLKNV